ncbi:MAG TPA: hypothetical protein DCQ30_16155 [Acidimicrobiaceae bacterium]|nr:hypothetical protein [Acidimicrobiaceae bacterium]
MVTVVVFRVGVLTALFAVTRTVSWKGVTFAPCSPVTDAVMVPVRFPLPSVVHVPVSVPLDQAMVHVAEVWLAPQFPPETLIT